MLNVHKALIVWTPGGVSRESPRPFLWQLFKKRFVSCEFTQRNVLREKSLTMSVESVGDGLGQIFPHKYYVIWEWRGLQYYNKIFKTRPDPKSSDSSRWMRTEFNCFSFWVKICDLVRPAWIRFGSMGLESEASTLELPFSRFSSWQGIPWPQDDPFHFSISHKTEPCTIEKSIWIILKKKKNSMVMTLLTA